MTQEHRVVIVGGGFGGLYAAKELGRAGIDLTLVDRRNFHLFQPLLYQVATGGLSPGDIASPLRLVLKKHKKTTVLQSQISDIDPRAKTVQADAGPLPYDTLIVAAGMGSSYFGNDQWRQDAPPLKSVEDALAVRRRILTAFEAAEKAPDEDSRQAYQRFVVVGGGPTGVELAGALGELAHGTLKGGFRGINLNSTEILLVERGERILPMYPPELSQKAARSLEKLGVTIRTDTAVLDLDDTSITLEHEGQTSRLETRTVLWGAGMQAVPLATTLAQRTDTEQDRQGRLMVEPNLSLPNHPDIFVIGDLAHWAHHDGPPLPGVAQVAMQQGRYVARLIRHRLQDKVAPQAFRYSDRGNLTVIGRHAAVADINRLRFAGWPAWLIWLFIHIAYLIEYDNKILVLVQWAGNYFTRKRGALLITEEEKGEEEQ
ncbi:MAG: NAD(P)-binding protein [Candidatus Latescibacteria bacterium]|nr:NAD(P)-binding protein [Candidatus Latescibacterota bacterium]